MGSDRGQVLGHRQGSKHQRGLLPSLWLPPPANGEETRKKFSLKSKLGILFTKLHQSRSPYSFLAETSSLAVFYDPPCWSAGRTPAAQRLHGLRSVTDTDTMESAMAKFNTQVCLGKIFVNNDLDILEKERCLSVQGNANQDTKERRIKLSL